MHPGWLDPEIVKVSRNQKVGRPERLPAMCLFGPPIWYFIRTGRLVTVGEANPKPGKVHCQAFIMRRWDVGFDMSKPVWTVIKSVLDLLCNKDTPVIDGSAKVGFSAAIAAMVRAHASKGHLVMGVCQNLQELKLHDGRNVNLVHQT